LSFVVGLCEEVRQPGGGNLPGFSFFRACKPSTNQPLANTIASSTKVPSSSRACLRKAPKDRRRAICLGGKLRACGPRRFHLTLTLAILTVAGNRMVPEILAVE
jgi:hypothetical protein